MTVKWTIANNKIVNKTKIRNKNRMTKVNISEIKKSDLYITTILL
jgi:hypothetical protein